MNCILLPNDFENFKERYPIAKDVKIFEVIEYSFNPHSNSKVYDLMNFDELSHFLSKYDLSNKKGMQKHLTIRFNIDSNIFNLFSIIIKSNSQYFIREESTLSEISFFLAENDLVDGMEISLKILLHGPRSTNAHKNLVKTFIHDYLKNIRGGSMGISEIKTSIREYDVF